MCVVYNNISWCCNKSLASQYKSIHKAHTHQTCIYTLNEWGKEEIHNYNFNFTFFYIVK